MAGSYDGIKSRVQDNATGVYGLAQRQLDRVVSPDTRKQAYNHTSEFAQERPLLFSFLLSQLVFSFLPLLLFATFAVSTVAFALGVAIIFSLFWIGIAMLLLVPALFVTMSIGVLVWIWAVSSFIVARWLYNIAPVSVKGGLEIDAPNGKKAVVVKKEDGFEGHTE